VTVSRYPRAMVWVLVKRFRIPPAPSNVGPGLLGHSPPVQEQVPRGIRTYHFPSH